MTKIQMFQTIAVLDVVNMILLLTFGNLVFEFVSYFDLPANAHARFIHSMSALLMPDLDHPDKQRLWQAGIRISNFAMAPT